MAAKAPYRVIAVSDNTNSFGLHGVVVVSPRGEAWRLGSNGLHLPKKGDELNPEMTGDGPEWGKLGFEIPERLENAPEAVVKEAWPVWPYWRVKVSAKATVEGWAYVRGDSAEEAAANAKSALLVGVDWHIDAVGEERTILEVENQNPRS